MTVTEQAALGRVNGNGGPLAASGRLSPVAIGGGRVGGSPS